MVNLDTLNGLSGVLSHKTGISLIESLAIHIFLLMLFLQLSQSLVNRIASKFLLIKEFFFSRVLSFLWYHWEEAPSHRFANTTVKEELRFVVDDLRLFSELLFSGQSNNLLNLLIFWL